jgi:phosphate transport system substrate-binding protein
MRRLSWLMAAALAVLALAACSGSSPAAAPASEQAAAAPATEAPAAEASAPAEGELPMVDPLTVTGDIVTAGSSTVYPLSEAMAERFINEGYGGNITIDSIGSGAGFERFCASGETDISNASRPIKESEIEDCAAIGRTPIEIRVGTDALAVVVNPENDWLSDGVTMEQLAQIFSVDAVNWSDVDAAWPAEPIQRFSPGTDSGTYDFFVEAVMEPAYGEEAETKFLDAANLQLSEDDNVLVQGVAGSKYGIGYFGYAYYVENEGVIDILPIDGVEATPESVDANSYPLARPLFIYTDAGIMQSKPQVAAFVNFYLTYVNEEVERVGYFPASDEALDGARAAWLAAMGQ